MSGGVDSSLSAALLLDQGYEVVGGFMKNWSDTQDLWTGECQWRGERRDAMRVCAALDIPLLTFDFETEYRERVLRRLLEESQKGLTPNPDVLCNEEIKFGLFFEEALRRSFDYVATGHYAQVTRDEQGKAHLWRGKDTEKDQSYFLHRVSQEALQQTLFPIGHLTKSEVRRLAEERGLPTAQKPDSQGICFVGKLDYHDFLRKANPPTPGDIVTADGVVIGRHDGLDAYTIGQRQGLLVSKDRSAWYVAKKDRAQNRLIVVPDHEDPLLFASDAVVDHVHWIGEVAQMPSRGEVAIRYRQIAEPATLTLDTNTTTARVHFDRPVWALAPGQSAVFYAGDECLGGGFIRDESLSFAYGHPPKTS